MNTKQLTIFTFAIATTLSVNCFSMNKGTIFLGFNKKTNHLKLNLGNQKKDTDNSAIKIVYKLERNNKKKSITSPRNFFYQNKKKPFNKRQYKRKRKYNSNKYKKCFDRKKQEKIKKKQEEIIKENEKIKKEQEKNSLLFLENLEKNINEELKKRKDNGKSSNYNAYKYEKYQEEVHSKNEYIEPPKKPEEKWSKNGKWIVPGLGFDPFEDWGE